MHWLLIRMGKSGSGIEVSPAGLAKMGSIRILGSAFRTKHDDSSSGGETSAPCSFPAMQTVCDQFVSGGSAGGQLACAVGLGLADGSYGQILDNRIQVRGILPYYPAIGLSTTLGIGGSPQWVDPVLLIAENSPPLSRVSGNP